MTAGQVGRSRSRPLREPRFSVPEFSFREGEIGRDFAFAQGEEGVAANRSATAAASAIPAFIDTPR
jgi:hypothetical protein